ncbi:uncharacterized protein LOC119636582 isoform X7 [Glossina fuscipes]|uniref:Uncharacterized protein LOC119636582 isoform X7 n=1 Tax=Glossina fuscipes TaxID=7396 RepID=A0A9C5Z1B9_9MUSC|nr:uncharacterized protein LOC119636582 isoform X7 [Glossina fuscipes]
MSDQRQLDLEREFSSLCPEDSFKTKELSPSELKFHSMALNHPNTTGWNVQSSSEVSPDGRAFRAETVAKTDGMEKIDGGKVEFKGHNEQCSSGSHQGDDKNFVKKSAESSKTHLEEKVVTGDENSRRSEVRMSSTTSSSSSKVVQSSSTTDYDNENFSDNSKYFDDLKRDQSRKAQSYQQEIKQNQQSDIKQNHQVVDQRRRETEQHINNRQERSVHNSVQAHETREVSKNYVDMDKASPEYQRHVQYLMSQPGEVVSNTVEYIKPNVKMITTVKHLPDGTIVRSKRYETEEVNSSGSNHGNVQTPTRPDKVEKPIGSTRRPSADVVDNFSNAPRSIDLQSQEAKFSTVKKSHQKFSTESKSQTIHESKERSDVPESSVRHFHPESSRQPSTDSSTPQMEMPPRFKNTVEYTEPIYQEKQPLNSQDTKQNIKELHVPTEEGETIIVTSEKRRDVKQQSKAERIVETEVIIDEAHQQNERYRQIANRPSEHPNSPQYTMSKAQPNISPRSHKVREQPEPIIPHSSVHVDDNVSIASSEKLYTNKRNFTSEFEITPSLTPSSAEPVVTDNWKAPVTSQGSRNIPVIERDIPNDGSQKQPTMRDTKPTPSTSPVKKPGSTTAEATRNIIQKEKELDAAHRAFAASLRGPSAVDSRRESYSDTQKHTPRSSISSNKTFRRDMREGSNDSTAPSDHSRITTNTVTKPTSSRHTPTKHTVHTTKKDHYLDDTNDVTYSPRNTKSPSPSKSVTSTSSATRMSKTIPRDVPKPGKPSEKTAPTVSSERRPKKCFATKTINLASEDRLSLSSKDMENVIIDIQHAKSSREASPDKIVPTPVPTELDVGKPRYPDLVQEPEDEPRNKSIEKNIPIFEEETNAYVRCHVSEVYLQNQTNVTDSHFMDIPYEPDNSPSIVMTDDDECLLTVQEKVSKFSQASEEIRKPKSISKPYNKTANASKVDKTDDKEFFVSHDKRNLDSAPVTEGSTFETLNINANISDGVLRELSTTVKLAPSTPQKSPELVRHISKHMTTSYQAEEDLEEIESNSKKSVHVTKNLVPQKLEKFSPDDLKDKMIPHTASHTTDIEMRRQNDILSRPSVFQARLAPRPNSMPVPTEARTSQIARHVVDDIESDYKRHIGGKPVSKDAEPKEKLGQVHLTHKTPKSPSPTKQNFPTDVSFKHQQSIETKVSSSSINQSLKKSETPGNQVTDYPNVSSTHPQHSDADISAKMVLDTAKPVPKYTNGSVTSRRNIFENHITMSKTNKKLDSSAPLFAGKRPSYMDHTKSSLEHTRRDSLEVNKSNFLRKPSRDDETHTQNERATSVKFDIPQAVGKAINLTGDVGEEVNVEEIFDINVLEQMLEESTSYELRRRIRAQIRLLRKDSTNDENYKTNSHITSFEQSDKEFGDSRIESERSHSPKHKMIRSDLKKEIRQETDSQTVVGKVKSFTFETVDSNDVEVSKSLKNPKYSSPHISSNVKKTYPSQSPDSSPDRRNSRKTHEVCTSSQRRSPSPKSPERRFDDKSLREFQLESQRMKESNVSTYSRSQHNKSSEIDADRHSREPMQKHQKMQQGNVSPRSGTQRNRYSERKLDGCNSNHVSIEAQKLSEKNFTSESRSQLKKQSQHSHNGYDSYDSASEMKDRSISPESRSLTRKLSERNSDYQQTHSCTLECQKIAQSNVCPQLTIQSKRSPKQSPDRSNIREATADTRKLHDRKVSSQSETQFKKSPERSPSSSKARKISPSGPQSKRSPERSSDCSKVQYASPPKSQPIKSRELSPDHNDSKANLWEQKINRRNVSPPSRSQHPPKENLSFVPDHSAKEVNISRTVSPDAKRAVTMREHTISSQQKIQRVISGSPENVSSTPKSNVRQEYVLKKTAKQKYETDSKTDAKVPIWVNRSNVLKPKASRKSTPANAEVPTIYNKTAKTTFTQKEISTKQEQDSVISSYGIGPTDENGLPLFGIKALKKKPTLKPSDITEEVTGYVIEERSYSDNKTAPIKQRQEFYYSTNPNQLKQLTNQISEKKSTYQDNYILNRKDDEKSMKEFSGSANIAYVSHSRENEKNDKNLYRETSPNLKKDRSDFYQTSEEDNYKISTMTTDDDDSDPYQIYHTINDNESARETDEIQQIFTSTTKSFLNSEEKVMHNVSDVLELMKNADNVVEEGDTASDQEARALLNKFLGASIIMKGAEAATSQIYQKNNTTDDSNRLEHQEVKIIRKTKTKTGNSSSSVSRTTCDLEEIWDEYILKELLDQAKTYEERRKIRARLRELMAEREEKNSQSDKLSESEVEKKVVVQEEEEEEEEDETSASESAKVIEESSADNKKKETSTIDLKKEKHQQQQQQQATTSTTAETITGTTDDGTVVTSTTKVTTRTVAGTAVKPLSPFAKFKQLDTQNSQQQTVKYSTINNKNNKQQQQQRGESTVSPTTTVGNNAPIFQFTDPALNARAATVKEQLLQWCQSKTMEYENVQITNFSTSWSDGLAFCALIHHFLPGAFDYNQLTPQNRRKNFELAFTVADEKAGIAPLLDVEDMVAMKRPDWKCVFVYVQSVYRRFRNCQ